ncbi:MAG: glucokinase [Gammaproteobacteria bacterium]|nr:glucokinase [Gammaproteobacteria bacterium]
MSFDPALTAPLLVGDIGGTNARFALYDHDGAAAGSGKLRVRAVLAASDHAHFIDAVQAFLSANAVLPKTLSGASFAVACPLGVGEVRFTNSPWRFLREELQQSLQLSRLVLVNDFEALALSVPRLSREQFNILRAGEVAPGAPKIVLGPGTGLGVAGIVPLQIDAETRWRAVPGEGGHVAFAPLDDFEFDLLRHLRSKHSRVSVERVVCGDGLESLHAFLLSCSGVTLLRPASAAEITREALAGDSVAREAVMRFLAILGSFAGDCALLYAARGGVYFGGGILPRIWPLVTDSPLIERFDAKGRMAPWISRIPLRLVTDDTAALRGAAIAAHPSHVKG